MKGEAKVTLEETLDGYRIAQDAVSEKGTMSRSKKAWKGCKARSTKAGRRSYEKTRSSSRFANKSREYNMNEVSQGKRKRERGIVKYIQNPYVEQIDAAIQELDSRLGIQKKLKAGYEKRLQYMKEILMSYSSLRRSASEEVNSCRAQIEKIKARTGKRAGSIFAEKLVGEICGLWQSGTTENEETLNELLTAEKYIISECVNKSHSEYETYRKRLEEKVMIEQACKRNRDEKASDLENIEGRIIEVNAAIAELQSALEVQQKYRKKLRSLRVSKKRKNGGCSLYPRPIGHPICAKSDTNDDIIVISVSPCPVCTLGFEAKTLDIIVASCGRTFHPFCLVSDGKLLRKCPKCLCQMHEMWLKSFGIVEDGTFHSQPKNTEKFSASSQAVAESTMESSEKSDTASTLAQVIADLKSTMTGCE